MRKSGKTSRIRSERCTKVEVNRFQGAEFQKSEPSNSGTFGSRTKYNARINSNQTERFLYFLYLPSIRLSQ
jgi:hypothetical protein